LQSGIEKLPDHRTGENTVYEIKDAALSAFGIFFTQSKSFLVYQRLMEDRKGKSNVQGLFRVERTGGWIVVNSIGNASCWLDDRGCQGQLLLGPGHPCQQRCRIVPPRPG